jgi:hypothetical protein
MASNNEGRIYAFRGQSGTGGAISIGSADAVVVGSAAAMRIGSALTNLGPVSGSLPWVGAGNLVDPTAPGNSGSVFAFTGNTSAGPFVSKSTFYMGGGGNTGVAVVGGGIPGRDTSYSLIGGTNPDLVVLAKTATGIDIVDGGKISGLASPYDANGADVHLSVPTGWTFTSPAASLIPDVDGDGHPDFVISNATSAVPGTIAVYW